MHKSEIAYRRFYQQGLLEKKFATAVDAIAALGAVQAQDYYGAKWAVARRTEGEPTDGDIEELYNQGAILRTHLLRPTWHFVTPADLRWLLALTAPRVHQANAHAYRSLELDDATFRQAHTVMVNALQRTQYLTREALGAAMQAAGIAAGSRRLNYLVMHAELEGIICSGPRQGKHFTYALLEDRVPPARPLDRAEALAELTKRYFTSHGPALIKDFLSWAKLTVKEAKEGLALAAPHLEEIKFNSRSYWAAPFQQPTTWASPTAHMLPNFDEAVTSFADYSASMTPDFERVWSARRDFFSHFMVIDGRAVGTWKRTLMTRAMKIESIFTTPISERELAALHTAADTYGKFHKLPVVWDG